MFILLVVVQTTCSWVGHIMFFFFFQAEDGIRDAQESRGLGDVYKRQTYNYNNISLLVLIHCYNFLPHYLIHVILTYRLLNLSLIHI